MDILDRDALSSFYGEAGPFDLMVNTAVPAGREQGPFAEMNLDGFQATFNKLWGYVNTVTWDCHISANRHPSSW